MLPHVATVSTRWPRCAVWAREEKVDPAGTAPRCDVFVLVEHPLPWPSDIGDDPLFASVDRAVREHAGSGRSVRLQALAVEPGAPTRRVIVFAAGDAPFSAYGCLEGHGTPDQLTDIAATLVAAEPPQPLSGRVTDVLVCTHGAHDACCGSFGTRLWRDAQEHGTRVWRTSHMGGHRFAPTAITFPDGNYWAYLDAPLLAGIVDRSLPADVAAAHLRGCAAFSPPIQVADRAAFAARGWEWLSSARFGEERSASRVELCFQSPAGERGTYDVGLADGRQMPVPECGNDPADASKSQAEWHVTRMQLWP